MSALRRVSRLGRTEMILFWRNRIAVDEPATDVPHDLHQDRGRVRARPLHRPREQDGPHRVRLVGGKGPALDQPDEGPFLLHRPSSDMELLLLQSVAAGREPAYLRRAVSTSCGG
jgi:hypothetical protein